MKTIRSIIQPLVVGACITFFGHAFPGFATTNMVLVGNGGLTFSPTNITINVNDTIIWNWKGNTHNVTSESHPASWTPPPTSSMPFFFTNTFNSTGTFPYECTVHVSQGMTGEVFVAAVDLPPMVSITNPPDGVTFSAPASITLAAMASDSDGSVTNVQFFQGATLLGNDATTPYSISVNNLSAADYTFSAVATDNGGLKATNTVTIHVVTPVSIVVSAPAILSPSDFQFSYTANAGLNYVVQRSTNLIDWTDISTNRAAGSSGLFTDPDATGNPGFYRVGLLPNP